MLAKPAKICQRYARTSGEICTLILEGDGSVQMAVLHNWLSPFQYYMLKLGGLSASTKFKFYIIYNYNEIKKISQSMGKCRSFPHDRARPGGIPPPRHLEKFSQIFRA